MLLDETPLKTYWRIGKVTATFPGKDGLVRTVDVAVQTVVYPDYYHKGRKILDPKDLSSRRSIMRRPITKIAPLMTVSSPIPEVLQGGEDVRA